MHDALEELEEKARWFGREAEIAEADAERAAVYGDTIRVNIRRAETEGYRESEMKLRAEVERLRKV
jgi:hypothetical protein